MANSSIPQMYGSLYRLLMQHIPDECDSRLTNLVWLMVGIYGSRSVQLNLLVRKLPIRVKKLSLVTRMGRWLANPKVRVRDWYAPFAQTLLAQAGSGGQVHLIIDKSRVSGHYQLMMVAVAYRRRALPIAWTWVRGTRGASRVRHQVALLKRVQGLLPTGVRVSLVGDTEFGNPLLIEYVEHWGWDYVLREASDTLIWAKNAPDWQRLDSLSLDAYTYLWQGNVVLTRVSAYPTHIVACHASGEKRPWLLATNLLLPQPALKMYRRRMWIEEMFGDMKAHGFDLENSHLRHFQRLSRLTLAVALLYIWLVALGEHLILTHQTAYVDRADRQDLSVFRLGWDLLERLIALADPIPDLFFPNFCSVSGG
jgi:hypothetical protein